MDEWMNVAVFLVKEANQPQTRTLCKTIVLKYYISRYDCFARFAIAAIPSELSVD